MFCSQIELSLSPFRLDWNLSFRPGSSMPKEITFSCLLVIGNDPGSVSTCIIRLSASFCFKAMSRHVRKVCFFEERLSHTKHSIAFFRKLLNILFPPPWLKSKGVTSLIDISKFPSKADKTRCTLHFFPLSVQLSSQSFSTNNWCTLSVPIVFSSGYVKKQNQCPLCLMVLHNMANTVSPGPPHIK